MDFVTVNDNQGVDIKADGAIAANDRQTPGDAGGTDVSFSGGGCPPGVDCEGMQRGNTPIPIGDSSSSGGNSVGTSPPQGSSKATADAAGAFALSLGIKNELIDFAGKGVDLGSGTAKYLKYSKGLGMAGGIFTSTMSLNDAYNYYSNGGQGSEVGIKTTLDIVMTGVGFLGPVGFGVSATYFIIDYATDGFGGYGNSNSN
ncbi:hypothetical protein [Aequorivita viscosa]|uniref:Uncharacterized protein n=1 Tax=Aequorivita viscosa TaxID=797419 RepID=A0A1M6PMS0_9FLAO|nr:hypothetical protein [Aequorivita viscosa]SDX56608.1 hypothetical protein SAMN05216556_1489 [Aequorivita viscosa]SHK09190.1 hypothetical protein SAMN04487908_1533 [Aequorivita viscosa]